jgi:hypothetical protein
MYGQEQPKSLGGISASALVMPVRDTEISRVMNELQSVVGRYDFLVGRLHDRLACVSTLGASTNSIDKAKEPAYFTELASSIDSVRLRLRDITDNLEGLYERIEL